MINKKILILAFETKLKKIFNNNESIVTKIFENFFFSFNNFNLSLKLLINFFLFISFFVNFLFIIFFFFKLRTNYFAESVNFLSKFPYFKNIHNFITANLLLHIE